MCGCVWMYWSVHLSTSMSTSGKKSLTLNSKPNSFYLTIIFPLSKISACAPSTIPHRSHRVHLFSSLLIEMKWSSFPIPQICICISKCFSKVLLWLLAWAVPLAGASTSECLVQPYSQQQTFPQCFLPPAPELHCGGGSENMGHRTLYIERRWVANLFIFYFLNFKQIQYSFVSPHSPYLETLKHEIQTGKVRKKYTGLFIQHWNRLLNVSTGNFYLSMKKIYVQSTT